jgi:CRP/FNR family cyclic AMP-dependent transcriptional regulator
VPDNTPKVLTGMKLLQDVPPAVLAEVETHCRYKKFAAGEQIFDRHAQTKDIFFVIKGKVRVVNYSFSGREVTLDDVTDGQQFGELAAIDGEPRSASVMALTECLIVVMPSSRFLALLEEIPALALSIMQHLCHLVRFSTERIMDLSTLGANNRVHLDLLRLAQSSKGFDGVQNQVVLKPIPVHGDIASRVSTTRETVARVVNDLARKGIVERTKNSLIIHDLEKLEGLVEEVQG